jgi:hypothetical protein
MEILKQYWYVFLIGAALIYVLMRRGSSTSQPGYTVQTIGADTAALDAQQTQATQQTIAGLIGSLLNYDLTTKQQTADSALQSAQLQAEIQAAQIQADAQTQGSNLQYQFQLQQLQAQADAIRRQTSTSAGGYLQGISSIFGSLMPVFAGQGLGQGGWPGYGTQQPIFGGYGGGGIFH